MALGIVLDYGEFLKSKKDSELLNKVPQDCILAKNVTLEIHLKLNLMKG